MTDNVNNPIHYNQHSVKCIEFTRHMDFNLGNAFKYIWRCYDKSNPIEDLSKAIWYLEDAYKNMDSIDLKNWDLLGYFRDSNLNFKSKNIEYCLIFLLQLHNIPQKKFKTFFEVYFIEIRAMLLLEIYKIKTIKAKNDN